MSLTFVPMRRRFAWRDLYFLSVPARTKRSPIVFYHLRISVMEVALHRMIAARVFASSGWKAAQNASHLAYGTCILIYTACQFAVIAGAQGDQWRISSATRLDQ